MISEDHVTLKTGVNVDSALITGINYISKSIQIENNITVFTVFLIK